MPRVRAQDDSEERHGALVAAVVEATDFAETRSERVYRDVFNLIMSGRFPPGERLPAENELSAVYGVSRPVVRQALAKLRAEGLIESRQGAGTFAKSFSDSEEAPVVDVERRITECLRLYEYRLILEPEIAAVSARRRADEHLRRIRRAIDDDKKGISDGNATADRDLAVHMSIAHSADNLHLVKAMQVVHAEINLNTFLVRHMMCINSHAGHLDQVCDEHEAVFQAISAHDANAARDAMKRHLESGRNFVLERHLEYLKGRSSRSG